MSYNSRRNVLGAITLGGKIAYHLWNLGYSVQKNNYSVTLLKKPKWHSQHSNNTCISLISSADSLIFLHIDNYVAGIDFHPNGELVATIDMNGVCLVTDVSSNEYRYHQSCKTGWSKGN